MTDKSRDKNLLTALRLILDPLSVKESDIEEFCGSGGDDPRRFAIEWIEQWAVRVNAMLVAEEQL